MSNGLNQTFPNCYLLTATCRRRLNVRLLITSPFRNFATMAEYLIKMADERGHFLEQTENGGSEVEVRDRFAQQGFLIYSVKPKGLFSTQVGFPRRRKIKQEQFVILIHAALPIIQSLELLIRRQRNLFFRSVLQNVHDRVRGGELLLLDLA